MLYQETLIFNGSVESIGKFSDYPGDRILKFYSVLVQVRFFSSKLKPDV